MDKSNIYKDLEEFIKIESVSSDKNRSSEILKAVDFLENKLKSLDFNVQILKKENALPLIIGTSRFRGAGKTIGIYAHYDVQSEDPVEEWRTQPFKLTIKNGKLFGRGVADDKGHIIQNLVAINRLIETNKLKNNIVFILEGEEEVGSINFEDYVNQAQNVFKNMDLFYVIDEGMHTKNLPQIFYGLRGLVYFEIDLQIGERDMHSGIYGNRVLNPIQVLADLFCKIKDARTGKILIPHFYDKVRKIEEKELRLLAKTKRSDEEEKKEAQVYKVVNVDNKNPYLSTKIYPSFDIHGIQSGFNNDGSKTVIPYHAMAKFSFRLVEYQDPNKIEALVKKFIADNLSEGVKYNLTVHSKASPFYNDINNQYMRKTAKILADFFGSETLFNRSGGSIAAAEILQRLFKKPIILTGFTLPDDNIHAPNENFDEEMFFKGIEALEKIYENI